jgi:hypothetical protein
VPNQRVSAREGEDRDRDHNQDRRKNDQGDRSSYLLGTIRDNASGCPVRAFHASHFFEAGRGHGYGRVKAFPGKTSAAAALEQICSSAAGRAVLLVVGRS